MDLKVTFEIKTNKNILLFLVLQITPATYKI